MLFSGFMLVNESGGLRDVDNSSFTTGEKLNYRVHYGIINAAESVIDVAPEIHKVNERPCYKVNVFGKTVGSFDFFLRIRDTWRSYIDTTAIVPQKFFRNIEEGKYRKKETVIFDHGKQLAMVEGEQYKVPTNVQDLVSGFFYMRTLDFNKYKPGDHIKVTGFFDDEIFNFDVVYKGRETVETKVGNIRCLKLTPQMPKNQLFDGPDAISVYMSDDRNKIPVKISAKMFVGAVEVDITKYSGLRSPLNLAQR